MNAPRMNHASLRLAAATLTAAAVWPQPALAGDHDQDVRVRTKGVWVMNDDQDEAGHRIEVRVNNGEVTVKMDGKDVPDDRIRMDDGQIVILDRDGNELKSFGVFLGDYEGDFDFNFGGGWPNALDEYWTSLPESQPNVMLGVHMSEPDDAVLYHLRLDPGESTMITGIYENLPAHSAGLALYDVITAIDGRKPATPEVVRNALADLQPGDKITLTAIHEGRTKEYDVRLEAFDPARMQSAHLIGRGRVTAEIVIPEKGTMFMPEGGNWRRYLTDPNTQKYFRQWFQDSGLPKQLEEQLSDALREHLPKDLDDRLERLNVRLDDLKSIIDALIDQAQEIAEDYERSDRDR